MSTPAINKDNKTYMNKKPKMPMAKIAPSSTVNILT